MWTQALFVIGANHHSEAIRHRVIELGWCGSLRQSGGDDSTLCQQLPESYIYIYYRFVSKLFICWSL